MHWSVAKLRLQAWMSQRRSRCPLITLCSNSGTVVSDVFGHPGPALPPPAWGATSAVKAEDLLADFLGGLKMVNKSFSVCGRKENHVFKQLLGNSCAVWRAVKDLINAI